MRTPVPDTDLRNVQISIMAFIANVLYRRMKINKGILVYDVQKLLARYEERFNPKLEQNDLFDLVSNKFLEFPQHIIDLESLVKD
jgi:hypothetical protein